MGPTLLLSIAIVTTAPAAAQVTDFDAVAIAPNSHQVLMEDDNVRVLRVVIAPGATEPVHDHRWPSIMIFEQPQPITYIAYKLADGRPVETQRTDVPALKPLQTVRGEAEDLHAVSNRGPAPFVAIRLELKKPKLAAQP